MRGSAPSYWRGPRTQGILATTVARRDMDSGNKRKPPRDDDSKWQESRLPGQRSGEGLKDLFELLLRDIRRKAGLPPKSGDDPKS